ncbi:MAG TPA: OB-fold nucleic acid binding domain-containing protein, partial [Fimbriimonadaceae bacterium]|nr:OB-fold nucleic acid binding domain-containing protein [Fimbriimonadaceae bacterium]
MAFEQRTIDCGSLRAEHTGQTVTLNGWAHKVRDLGGLLFVDLRDRTGLVQVVFYPEMSKAESDIRSETCLSVTGEVRMRDEKNRNPKMATGDVEVVATAYTVLSQCK